MNTPHFLCRAAACSCLALLALSFTCRAAELSGRITAADGTTPIPGIEVQARFLEDSWYSDVTDVNGEYQFSNLPAGSYRIRIEDNNLNTYLPEWYADAASYAGATPFVLAQPDVVTGVDASLAEGARLVGTITADTGGAPLAGIRVAAFRAPEPPLSNWQLVKSRFSLADGSYDLGGLPGGTYRLRFSDDAGNYAPEHHNNQIEFDNAAGILLPASGTVTTNASLANASVIQGTVTDGNGANPLAGIFVNAYRNNGSGSWRYVNQTTTQTDGTYNLKGLTAGDHRLEFSSSTGFHQREYYDDETDFASATAITLGTGVTLTGHDASLAGAGLIEGVITDASGSFIPGISVIAYRLDPTSSFWEFAGFGFTEQNGNYVVGGLATGTYRLEAYSESGTYVREYYNDQQDIGSADDVAVTAGSSTQGINMTLEELIVGSLSGTVTNTSGDPLAGIEVALFRYNDVDDYWEGIESIATDVTGQYRRDNLEVGTYRIRFVDPTETHASEHHLNAATVESALDVVVSDGNETVVDAVLADAASLSGTVTDNAAASIPGIWVNLHRLDPATGQRVYISSRTSGANGTYSFGGLMSGTYFVDFSDFSPSVTYAREYYNGKTTSNAADAVTLLEGQDVTGIDATLDLASQLTGTVSADASGNPIQFVSVTAYRLNEVSGNWDYASGASTNAAGVYTMQGLTAGSYRVGFYDFSGNHLREFHNDKATLALADSFTIASGGAVVIDASLASASRIEGTVTREGSGIPGTPLPGIKVDAYRVLAPDSFEYVFSATTGTNGNYSVGGLTAGNYRISINDTSGYYFSEVYANATGLSAGANIVVAATSTTSGIDAALIAGGRISGTVTDAVASSALEGIGIYFYRDNGVSWVYEAYAESDSAGAYISPALQVGQYRVEFYDFSELPSYRGEYHDNTYNFNDSTAVTVNALQTTGSINAALSPINQSNVISGSVTDDATSAALAGIYAQAYRFNSVSGRYEFEAEAVSDGAGAYRIENLPSGVFRVRFSDRTNGVYAQQFYAGASTLTGGAELSLGTQGSITGIDAAMLAAMTISGTVRNESGDGIEGVWVFVRRWEQVNNDWFFVNSTQTLAGGAYSVNGLPDGIYRVEFLPVGGSGYFREFYDDAQTIGSATDLHVFQYLNGSLADIDAELSTSAPVTVTPAMSGFRKTGPTSYQSDFQGQPGTLYQLERSPTMLPHSWMPDGAPFEAQPGGDVLNMSSSEPRMFWRVREN